MSVSVSAWVGIIIMGCCIVQAQADWKPVKVHDNLVQPGSPVPEKEQEAIKEIIQKPYQVAKNGLAFKYARLVTCSG